MNLFGRKEWWQRPWIMFLAGAGMAAGLLLAIFPPVSAAVMHVFDRWKNGAERNDELKVRANFYRNQIAAQLGISPDRVGAHEFKMAAQLNPQLRAVYQDVVRKESRENRGSLMMNTGVAFVPVLGHGASLAAHAVNGARMLGQGLAGTGVSMLFNKEIVSSQEVAEAITTDMVKAQQQGVDIRQVVTPQAIFMLRVSQDEALSANIKKTYGKSFHKLTAQEQGVVMSQVPALATAVQSEAHAVASGIMPIQELIARAPNLDSSAARYAAQPRATSFADAEMQRRAAAASQAAQGPAV